MINYWRSRPVSEQFDLDAAMWCGAVVRPGDASIATFMKKLFGVMYNTEARAEQFAWSDAEPNNLPVASFLSHGRRVIIQLPLRTAYDDPGQALFNWLTAEVMAAGS